MAFILVLLQLWTTIPDPQAIFQGNWQSCRTINDDDEVIYGEKIYDYTRIFNGKTRVVWSLHLGPVDDFAIFKAGTEPDPDDHDTRANLLGTAHRARSLHTKNGRRSWTVPSLGIRLQVSEAGGSRDECEKLVCTSHATSGLALWTFSESLSWPH